MSDERLKQIEARWNQGHLNDGDVAFLLEEVKRLEKDNWILRDLYQGMNEETSFQDKERWKLKEENARYREALAECSDDNCFLQSYQCIETGFSSCAACNAREALKEDGEK